MMRVRHGRAALTAAAVAVALGAAAPSRGHAQPPVAAPGWCHKFGLCGSRNGTPGGVPAQTPEIDPSALRGALTVLAGGALVLLDRRRRR